MVRGRWLAIGAVFGGLGLALTVVVLARGGAPGVLHVVLTPLVGWSYGAAGLIACLQPRWRRVGALMIAVGLAWFVHLLDWTHVPALETAGAPFRNAYAAVAAHLLLAFPTGRLGSWRLRALAAAGYLVAVGLPPAGTGYDVQSAAGLLLACVVAAVLARRAWRAPAIVWHAGIAAFVALVANMLTGWLALWVAFSAALAAVPLGFLVSLAGVRLRRAALVVRLGRIDGPAQLRDALADALGDRSLTLAFWVPERQDYVDEQGRPAPVPATATLVERDGHRVGALVHDPRSRDEPELVEAVTAVAALALDRARLQAELRARIAELHASRARLVEATAAERRRIERNLHDGAQQRLVSVAFSLGLAQSRLTNDQPGAGAALAEARTGLATALAELRRLSQGIHPGVLVERGLRAAVAELTWNAPAPVAVDWDAPDRLPDDIETAAYYVIAEALANTAKHARAGSVRVGVKARDGLVRIEIADDGAGGADPAAGAGLRGLGDRVAALGGDLTVDSPAGEGTTVRMEVPCG
jgi:signal transduction histidine kinase